MQINKNQLNILIIIQKQSCCSTPIFLRVLRSLAYNFEWASLHLHLPLLITNDLHLTQTNSNRSLLKYTIRTKQNLKVILTRVPSTFNITSTALLEQRNIILKFKKKTLKLWVLLWLLFPAMLVAKEGNKEIAKINDH